MPFVLYPRARAEAAAYASGMKWMLVLLGCVACGGATEPGPLETGPWCCFDDAAGQMTCELSAARTEAWTAGPCWDATLPEESPLHPGR